MARTVYVGLALQVAEFVRGGGLATKTTKDIGEGLAEAAKAGDTTATTLDHVAEEMTDAARAAAGLDRQIDDLTGSLRELAIQQAITGDAGGDLARQLKDQQAQLRQAMRGRKLIDPGDAAQLGLDLGVTIGVSTAQGFFASFTANIRGLATSPAGIAVGTAIAVPAAAVLGATLSGAVIGAAGAGGVIGGLMVVSKDTRVQASAADLGEVFRSTMEDSALAFIPAAQRGMGVFRRLIHDSGDELEGIFDKAATFVEPLARGVAGFIRPIIRGVSDLVDSAGPIIDVLETDLPMVGDAIGDVLSDISKDADVGASAIHALMVGLSDGIRIIGTFIGGLADLYRGLVTVGLAAATVADTVSFDWLPPGAKAAQARDQLQSMADTMNRTGESGQDMGDTVPDSFNRITDAAAGTAGAVERVEHAFVSLSDAVGAIVDKNLAAAEAQLRLRDATKAAADAVDGKRKVSTKEQESLIGLAQALNTSSAAMDEQGVSADVAAAAHGRNRKQMVDAAIAAGHTREKAEDLADQWLKIPKSVKTTVTESGSAAVKAAIASIPGRKDVHVAMRLTGYANISGTIASLRKNQRHGGIYEKAQDGLLNEASYYTPRNPGRYMIAEPGTQGEAFIPKNGDYDRSMQILNGAAGWYGARVVPGGAGGGGGQTTVHNHNYAINVAGGYYGNRVQALDWFVGMLDEARMRGRA